MIQTYNLHSVKTYATHKIDMQNSTLARCIFAYLAICALTTFKFHMAELEEMPLGFVKGTIITGCCVG